MLRIIAAAKGVFQPCPECFDSHRGSRDSHVSIIDVDDAMGRRYCHFCKPAEGTKRLVQIRRNTYSDGGCSGSQLFDGMAWGSGWCTRSPTHHVTER